MASSQKQFEEMEVPGGVMDIMLAYDKFDKVSGHAMVPLVPTLFNSIKKQKLIRLLTAIVSGDLDKVKKIIEKTPSLLLEKLEEKDFVVSPSGQRSNNATPYRTALAVGDIEMAKMIKAKLTEIAGEEEANTQYREQFPEGWEAIEAKRCAPVFTQLESLALIIKDAKLGDITSSGHPKYELKIREGSPLAVALAQLRSQLNALLHEIVTSGRHFNPNLLLQAFKIYDDYYKDFGKNWNDPHVILFWRQVIGTFQRGMSAPYVQVFCNKLVKTVLNLENNIPQPRSLILELFDNVRRTWIPTNFYPIVDNDLGFVYAIDSGGGVGQASQTYTAHLAWTFFEVYVNRIQDAFKELQASPKTLEDSPCLAW